MIDSTSMWVELVATEDCTADTVVKALFDNVVSRFGLPRGISFLTDNGSAFVSRLQAVFCKTFKIKQLFTSLHHPQTNSRAEEFGDTLNKSLRILCASQTDWSSHLQAVAMAYRATATTNTGLSPHEVIFGRPMPLAIDWSLLAEEPTIPSIEAYMEDIRPKLHILHQIAIENARDNAQLKARRVNETAVPPSFKCGDKVLLFNPVVKKGECVKLKRRYVGPYFIIDCRPGYNYMLKELSTGKELKRPVHANRFRSLRELDNDYRLQEANAEVRLLERVTPIRQIRVSVRVGNIVHSRCDVIVNPANEKLEHKGGAALAIARAAGESLEDECRTYIGQHGELAVATPLLTTSGLMGPTVKHVLHIVGPNAADERWRERPLDISTCLQDCFAGCLICANETPGVESVAIPAISTGLFGVDAWTAAHAAMKAIMAFDMHGYTDDSRQLRTVELVCLDLTTADTFNTVLRQVGDTAERAVSEGLGPQEPGAEVEETSTPAEPELAAGVEVSSTSA